MVKGFRAYFLDIPDIFWIKKTAKPSQFFAKSADLAPTLKIPRNPRPVRVSGVQAILLQVARYHAPPHDLSFHGI
jgi:hypothetical protein